MAFASRPQAKMLLADAALALPLGAIMVVGTHFVTRFEPGRPADAVTYVLVALAITALPIRRVLPRVALGIAAAATAVYVGLGHPDGPALLVLPVTQYTVGSRYPVRQSLVAFGASALLLVVVELGSGWTGWPTELAAAGRWLVGGLAPWAVGTVVRLRRESVQAARAEQARDRAYQERLRTAQDVHDIVGHGLAAISMQAGVALHVLDRSPEQAREILAAIKASSQDSLDELRATLAVFRSAAHGTDRGPAPGLDQLDALVGRTIEAGLPVELVRTGEQSHLPASVEMTAYRIVQESLTNVLRHAGPATATVTVDHGADELTVEVSDTGSGAVAGDGDGQGITGMRARAGAVGGTLEAGPRPEGGFTVRARLPVEGR